MNFVYYAEFAPKATEVEKLIEEIEGFHSLREGWDGENAAPPLEAAIHQAGLFVRAAGSSAIGLEATAHVDGSIILEIGDGSRGSFRFKGNKKVVYATESHGSGVVEFSGRAIPQELLQALSG